MGLGMLADAKAPEVATTHLLRLKRLQVSNLQGVKTLSKHLLWEQNLSLGKLDELGLALVLEVTKGADRLVDGATGTMSRLERSGVGSLVHVEVAHVLGLVFLGRLLGRVVLRLPPVALEVARCASAVACAAAALEIRLSAVVVAVVAWSARVRRLLRE